jgi:hypothetical protein
MMMKDSESLSVVLTTQATYIFFVIGMISNITLIHLIVKVTQNYTVRFFKYSLRRQGKRFGKLVSEELEEKN